jgi:peroxiredoxin
MTVRRTRSLRLASLALVLALGGLLLDETRAHADERKVTNFTVRDLNGKYVRLSDFDKNVLLMSFWATWCTPCLAEQKHLEKLYQKYKSKGFVVLGVSMDGPETQAKVKPFVQRYNLTYPVVIDQESTIVKLYNSKRSAPFSVYFKKGKLVKTREGFQVSDVPAIEKEIADLCK